MVNVKHSSFNYSIFSSKSNRTKHGDTTSNPLCIDNHVGGVKLSSGINWININTALLQPFTHVSPTSPPPWRTHNIWLVVEPPLWNIYKSVGIIIPNIWKNKIHVPNHQPEYCCLPHPFPDVESHLLHCLNPRFWLLSFDFSLGTAWIGVGVKTIT